MVSVQLTLATTRGGQQLIMSSTEQLSVTIDIDDDPVVNTKIITVETSDPAILVNSLWEISETHNINFDTIENSMSFTPKTSEETEGK